LGTGFEERGQANSRLPGLATGDRFDLHVFGADQDSDFEVGEVVLGGDGVASSADALQELLEEINSS
jgi:hypothetical protein